MSKLPLPPAVEAAYAVLDADGKCVCVCGANYIETVWHTAKEFAGGHDEDALDEVFLSSTHTWRLVAIEDARKMFGAVYQMEPSE